MTIFKFELKQLSVSMFLWSIILGVLIFLMTPVYIDMLTGTDMSNLSELSNQGYYETMGTNMQILSTPLGAYSFLTTFVLFACAVHGMNVGLSMITKEYRGATADFILTKPYSRSKVFVSKLLAGLVATLVVGAAYFVGSWLGMAVGAKGAYSFQVMALIACSAIFVQWIFLFLGMMLGVLWPHLRTTVTVSSGVAFFAFVTGSFSYKMGFIWLGFLSPFTYFKGADIISTERYDPVNLLVFALVSGAALLAGHYYFRKKDVTLVS